MYRILPVYTTLQDYGYPMEHSGRASQPKLSSKDHNVNPTGLTVLPNIKNVTDRIEKQKCHDDFQTKRNENPATPEIGQCLQRTARWSWSVPHSMAMWRSLHWCNKHMKKCLLGRVDKLAHGEH